MDPSDQYPLAIVTGAARRVGRMIALHLASKGYAIGLHYHSSSSKASRTAREIETLGVPVHLLRADLSVSLEIKQMFECIDEIRNPLRLLVNSAALMPESDLMQIQEKDWDNIMNLNARAVWMVSREAALRMKSRGVILNISDVGANKSWTKFGAYVVSKTAVEMLTRIMAKQLAPQIRVNAIAPGLLLRDEKISLEKWQELTDKTPMKKPGDFNQFLETLDLLVTNEYITGEIISISGGYQLV